MTNKEIQETLKEKANPKQAKILQKFFKTGPGEYGEGDIFLGIKVPEIRKVAKEYKELELSKIKALLKSGIHEERLAALLILIFQFEKANEEEKGVIFKLYLKNTKYINNWDLVDLSSPQIVGGFLLNKDTSSLAELASSKSIWERRIAVLASFQFIKNNHYDLTLQLAQILLNDKHDLIHKAVGWMLREIGKRDIAAEEKFLISNYKQMPRTMLRYAIEKFPENKRKNYLLGKV